MPLLETLTLRVSSVDVGGPAGFWAWASALASPGLAATVTASSQLESESKRTRRASLRIFRLHSFSTLGDTSVPRPFLLFLARTHGLTLALFGCGTALLSMSDVEFMCATFPRLEELSCLIANAEPVRQLSLFSKGLWLTING